VRFYSKIIIWSYATTNTCYPLFFVKSNFSRKKKTATTFWKFSGNISNSVAEARVLDGAMNMKAAVKEVYDRTPGTELNLINQAQRERFLSQLHS